VWIDASEWKWRGATAPTKRELLPVSVLKLIPITLLYQDFVYKSIGAEYKEARLNDMIQNADVKIFISVHGSGICPSHIIQFSECCAGKVSLRELYSKFGEDRRYWNVIR
jgi:hypothetical protein